MFGNGSTAIEGLSGSAKTASGTVVGAGAAGSAGVAGFAFAAMPTSSE